MKAIILLVALAVSGCCAQTPISEAPSAQLASTPPLIIPLSDYKGMLKTLPVTVAGKEQLFLFDTGGGVAVITPKVAREINCDPHGQMTGFRIEGQRVDLRRCEKVAMTIGGRTFLHETVGVFDLMKLLPAGWPEVSGLIALQTFESQTITLDRGERLIVETDSSARARVADAQQIKIRPSRQLGGESLDLMVAFDSNEGLLWAMLDSGCMIRDMLLAPHAASTLGLLARAQHHPADRTPGKQRPEHWTIPEAEITPTGLGPVAGRVVVKDAIYDGVICASIMKRWQITLDLERYRGWMKR